MKSRFSSLIYLCAILAIAGSVFYARPVSAAIECHPSPASGPPSPEGFQDPLEITPLGSFHQATVGVLTNTDPLPEDIIFTVNCFDFANPSIPPFSSSVTITVLPAPITVSCSPSSTTASINQDVTWTAEASAGAPPYSYTWTGDSPIVDDAGKPSTGNPVTVRYSTAGLKNAYVTVTDSNAQTQLNPPTQCSSAVRVSSPMADYGLNADPLAVMNFVGQSAVSNRVAIYVVSSSGFTDPVTLSASPSKIAGVEVTYVFYNHGTSVENATMTSDLYSKGIDMVIQAQTPIARGHYPDKITVTGASSIDHSVTISLDVNIIRPMFQEF